MNLNNEPEDRTEMRLDIAAYKAVHGSDCLEEDINSKEFMDECFKESPWCDGILKLMDEDMEPEIEFEAIREGMTSDLFDD